MFTVSKFCAHMTGCMWFVCKFYICTKCNILNTFFITKNGNYMLYGMFVVYILRPENKFGQIV